MPTVRSTYVPYVQHMYRPDDIEISRSYQLFFPQVFRRKTRELVKEKSPFAGCILEKARCSGQAFSVARVLRIASTMRTCISTGRCQSGKVPVFRKPKSTDSLLAAPVNIGMKALSCFNVHRDSGALIHSAAAP